MQQIPLAILYITMKSFTKFLEHKQTRIYHPMRLPQSIHTLHQAFSNAGKQLYIVGGAVRDHVLGQTPKDYDLATNALPEEVMQILDSNEIGRTEDSVGNQFGVVIARIDNEDYEIATFRKDLDVTRQTRVKFSTIEDDAARRDLTINALYYDLDSNEVIDLVGGLEDLRNRQVRPVGDADQRFGEDALRVLRFVRFYCRINPSSNIDDIDQETLNAIGKRINNGLRSDDGNAVAPERIRDEFLKGFKTAIAPANYLKLYYQLGLLTKYVFPNLNVSTDFPNHRNPILVCAHMLRNNDPDKIRRTLNTLTYSNDEVNKITYLIRLLYLRNLNDMLNQDPNFLYKLKRQQQNLTQEELQTWASWHGLNVQTLNQLMNYQVRRRHEIPGAQDVEGPALGKLIAQHNTDALRALGDFTEWFNLRYHQ